MPISERMVNVMADAKGKKDSGRKQDIKASNDQLGENSGEGRFAKGSDKKKSRK